MRESTAKSKLHFLPLNRQLPEPAQRVQEAETGSTNNHEQLQEHTVHTAASAPSHHDREPGAPMHVKKKKLLHFLPKRQSHQSPTQRTLGERASHEQLQQVQPSRSPSTTQHYSNDQQQEPGAFAAAPGQAFSRRGSNLRYLLAGTGPVSREIEPSGGSCNFAQPHDSGISPNVDNQNLVEAHIVIESQQNPVPVYPSLLAQQNERRRKILFCRTCGCAIIVTAIVVAAALVIAFFGFGKQENQDLLMGPSRPSATPTTSPTSSPTQTPTFLIENLPEYSHEAIDRSASPQYAAYQWVSEFHANATNWRKKQLFALATFYHSFGGDQWPSEVKRSWLKNPDECYWFSQEDIDIVSEFYGQFVGNKDTNEVNLCNDDGHFQLLALSLLGGIQGATMPPEISLLSLLEVLIVKHSALETNIASLFPPQLAELSNLKVLSYANNRLSGSLPSTIGLLKSLEKLHLERNLLNGQVPKEIGLLTGLQLLYIHDNNVTSFPSELGMLSKLELLNMYNNSITGIPTEIGLMSALRKTQLYYNHISYLPSEIGLLSSLYYFAVMASSIANIPTEIGLMTSLETLYLYNNSIQNEFPSEISQLTLLQRLWMQNNFLLSTLPTEIGRLVELKEFDLNNNTLTGSIPSEIGLITGGDPVVCEWIECTSLEYLDLSSNILTSTIPSHLGVLSDMKLLDLSFNSLSGLIPSELGLLTANISLLGNRLSGEIPRELCPHWCSSFVNKSKTSFEGTLEVDCDRSLECGESLCNCSFILSIGTLTP